MQKRIKNQNTFFANALTATRASTDYRRLTPTDPVPRTPGYISLLTPTAELLQPMEGSAQSSIQLLSPANELLFLYHRILLLRWYQWPHSVCWPCFHRRHHCYRSCQTLTGPPNQNNTSPRTQPATPLHSPTSATATVVQIPKRPTHEIGAQLLLEEMGPVLQLGNSLLSPISIYHTIGIRVPRD